MMYAQAHLAGFISQDEYKHQIAEGADHRTPFVPIPCREILNAASGDVGLMGVHNCRSTIVDPQLSMGLAPALSLKQGQYIELVQWTGQQIRPDKKGAIPKQVPAALHKTGCSATHWPTQVKAVGSGYWRMIGTTEQLMEKAEAIGQRWLKGIGITRQLQKA